MTAQKKSKKKELPLPIFKRHDSFLISGLKKWALDFFKWWYLTVPVLFVLSLRRTLTVIDDKLSVSFLIQNFLVPWHKEETFVGYLLGFVSKILVIPLGVILLILVFCIYILFLIFWVILPVSTISAILISPFISIN